MQKKTNRKKVYYFSKKLKSKLEGMSGYPLTIIEAPSGFGKTTAVREYLRQTLSDMDKQYWYTCMGEPPSAVWSGICSLLSNISKKAAEKLKKLEHPTLDTLAYVLAAIKEFKCSEETYVVIDNFQLANFKIPREIMSAFSMHNCKKLHFIFITQNINLKEQLTFHNNNVYLLNADAFFFDMESVAELFKMEGIRLKEEELKKVCCSTEGWISAIRLQIINYAENGTFDYSADIDTLVETAIWNKLDLDEKQFLLSVSVLDSFTSGQAAIMIEKEKLPEKIKELLKTNDFIRYFPREKIYSIHSILLDYLRNEFYQQQTVDFQNTIFYRAGKSYAVVGEYFSAVRFFYKIGDFDSILSLPFDGEYLSENRESELIDYIEKVAKECPKETFVKYPEKLLLFAYHLMFERKNEAFERVCGIINDYIGNGVMEGDKRSQLTGEYILLMSFTKYDDPKSACEYRKKAYEILGGPSKMVVTNIPWTLGSTSILNLLWKTPGKLDEAVNHLEKNLPMYLKLTGGHGIGANSVLRAEIQLMRGNDDEAEILCYRALYEAHSLNQIAICICAIQVLARVAILRGDTAGYFAAVRNLQNYVKNYPYLHVMRMADLCNAVINLEIGITKGCAKWLLSPETIKKTLYPTTVLYAQILYGALLLEEKRYNELFGISQTEIKTAKEKNILMPQVYYNIFCAAAMFDKYKDEEAQRYVREALEIAMPDEIYLPFAKNSAVINNFMDSGAMPDEYQEKAEKLLEIVKRHDKGAQIIRKAVEHENSPLTPREREIACLARERHSAKEIAKKLYISETTVNSTLRSIYNKLGIHSKSELSDKDF